MFLKCSVRFILRFLLAGLFGLTLVARIQADAFDDLRHAWWSHTTGGTNYDLNNSLVRTRLQSITNSANSSWSSMDKSPTRTYLWSDLTSTTISAQIVTAYSRLRAMALAHATYGSWLRGNAALAADIQSGLDWMYANRYNETKAQYDNWFHWEIGAPLQITDIAVLMHDTLGLPGLANSLKAVEHFTPSPTEHGRAGTFTGANLADRIRVVGVRGAVVRNAAKLAAARDALSNLFPFVTSGDGFYEDGSFIQHTRIPYTGSYGNVLLTDVAALLPWLQGSPWECVDPARTNVLRWVYEGYEPLIYRGAMMDMTRGRAISRSGSQDHVPGHSTIQAILRLSEFGTPADRARMRSMVKAWAQTDTYRNFTNNAPLPILTAAIQLMADNGTPARGELIGHWTFAGMDRAVHLRPGWGFGLSMYSSRVYNYEYMNGENLKGWFTSDGMTYLYNDDLAQFSDNYWATVDPYRLPGITVDTTPRADGYGTSKVSTKNWVGGATLHTNGVAGMELATYGSTLTARKSWFMFDNEVVCLGAGISCSGNAPIETIVENRRLSSATAALVLDGVTQPTTLGWSRTATNAGWASLANAGGYFFPGGSTVKLARQARTGSWSQINTGGSTTSFTRNYLTMWFDHGTQPDNSSYAYVLLPNYSSAQTASYAANPHIAILENSAAVQAVRETELNLVAANFWTDTPRTVDFITSSQKASVLTQESPTTLAIAVADPTQANSGSLALTLDRSAGSVLVADPAITVTRLTPTIQIVVNVNNARGRSFVAVFGMQQPPPFITAQPEGCLVSAGQSASFAVEVEGVGPMGYQWMFEGGPIAGANDATYSIPVVQLAHAGHYSVLVTNAHGAALSTNALLALRPLGGWGENWFGQIDMPADLTGVVAIAAGAWHSLALRTDGTVTAWGLDWSEQCAVPAGLDDAVAIAAGGYHNLAIRASGSVVAWGANEDGQCQVPANAGTAMAVAAGAWHSLALRADGTVMAWGDNSRGQTDVPPGLTNVTAVAAGGTHSLALRADGTVVAWGNNYNANGVFAGQSVVPLDLRYVVAIGAGTYHSLAAHQDGTITTWGDNTQGQRNVPQGLAGQMGVAGGGGHSLALSSGGTVTAWGANDHGQCNVPVTLSNVVAVAAGNAHTIVLLNMSHPTPRLLNPVWRDGTFSALVQTVGGRPYVLEFKSALTATNWTSLPARLGNGALLKVADADASSPQRFYRVRVAP